MSCGPLLYRIVHRFLYRLGVVVVRHLQIVLHRDRLRIADPLAHNLHRKPLGKLRLPRGPEVLKQLRLGR